jgi:hypothetical protein
MDGWRSRLGFFRAAAGMAIDLASTPSTGVAVQLCGDGQGELRRFATRNAG